MRFYGGQTSYGVPDTRVLLLVLLAALEGSIYCYVHVNLHRRRFFSAASRSTNRPTASAYTRTRDNEKSVEERIKNVKIGGSVLVRALVLLQHSAQFLTITFLPHQSLKSLLIRGRHNVSHRQRERQYSYSTAPTRNLFGIRSVRKTVADAVETVAPSFSAQGFQTPIHGKQHSTTAVRQY